MSGPLAALLREVDPRPNALVRSISEKTFPTKSLRSRGNSDLRSNGALKRLTHPAERTVESFHGKAGHSSSLTFRKDSVRSAQASRQPSAQPVETTVDYSMVPGQAPNTACSIPIDRSGMPRTRLPTDVI